MEQRIINSYTDLNEWLKGKNKPLVIGSLKRQRDLASSLPESAVIFNDYQPNPLYENVQAGVKVFRNEKCDSIIAIGGGSAIDVAKCIKLYSNLPGDGEMGSWLADEYIENNIPFLAMPTTAGTGSEATRYAVIYYDGKKQSVTSDSIIPDTVLMDPNTLVSLPIYQKKATMCDALCHAIESFWSVNSTDRSKKFSKNAIELVMANMDGYLANTEDGRSNMLLAANIAGKAINITQTTAGHAMCYKITTLFESAHGHAAMLCNRILLPWMIQNTDKCIDPRGEQYLKDVLYDITCSLGCETIEQGATKLEEIFAKLELEIPTATKAQFNELKESVNIVRLKNHPIALDEETIDMLYHKILNGVEK